MSIHTSHPFSDQESEKLKLFKSYLEYKAQDVKLKQNLSLYLAHDKKNSSTPPQSIIVDTFLSTVSRVMTTPFPVLWPNLSRESNRNSRRIVWSERPELHHSNFGNIQAHEWYLYHPQRKDILVLPHYVKEKLAITRNSRMWAQDRPTLLAASMRNELFRSQNLRRSRLKVLIYLLRKYATNQAIAEYDAAIHRYVQTTNMILKQFGDNLIAKSWRSSTIWRKHAQPHFYRSRCCIKPPQFTPLMVNEPPCGYK